MPSNLSFFSSDPIFVTDFYGESNGVDNDTPSSVEDREKDPFLSEVIFHLAPQVEFKDLEILPSGKNNESGFSDQIPVKIPDQSINFYAPRLSDVDKKTFTKKNVKRDAEEMEGSKGIGNEQPSQFSNQLSHYLPNKRSMAIVDKKIQSIASISPTELHADQPLVVASKITPICYNEKLKELGFSQRLISEIIVSEKRRSNVLENIEELKGINMLVQILGC